MATNNTQTGQTQVVYPYPIIALYTRQGYPSSEVLKYTTNYTGTDINTLIIAGPNGANGDIVYNDPPYTMFNSAGDYVGDKDWPGSLVEFARTTSIAPSSIFFSLSNSAIRTLAAMQSASLAKVLTWLKTNGIGGIDMDCENWGQPGGLNPDDPEVLTVTAAAIDAGLGLTAAPYNNMAGWQSWVSSVQQKGGTVAWFNVQCYAGGASNDPVGWATKFSQVPIVAGLEALPGTDAGAYSPSGVQSNLETWQGESPVNSLAGAFIWYADFIVQGPYTIEEYAQAMYSGVTVTQSV